MRIAVLVKQIPAPAQLRLAAGRLQRAGVDLEVNAYCRRANAKAVELAGRGGEVVVFTMGPPAADDALREMVACGAHRGVHLCDTAFAGADTLATARVLSAAITHEGPFDLVLCGANSLDADTGQVGPELAELLGLPFVGPARELTVGAGSAVARQETHDGHRTVRVALPAVVSTAERLCDPSKAPADARAQVAPDRIVRRSAFDLGLKRFEVGLDGSPTRVGPVQLVETTRRRIRAQSPSDAAELLLALGVVGAAEAGGAGVPATIDRDLDPVPPTGGAGPEVWCVLLADAPVGHDELLGEAARLAADVGGRTVAVVAGDVPAGLGARGADRVLVCAGVEPEDRAFALAASAARARPWALLVQGTATGRATASLVAARNGWGLTGDAVGFDVTGNRLVAWKPAFGGRLVAAIESTSPVQMATVRPGILARRASRVAPEPPIEHLPVPPGAPVGRVTTLTHELLDDTATAILRARAVVGVGQGVAPADYPLLDPLREALGGTPLAATRKVTDQGWLPRSRQVGVTGRAIAPELYVAIGVSGKFNHMVGVAGAAVVLAIDIDPAAPVFDQADIGLVGDWRVVVPALVDALSAAPSAPGDPPPGAGALPGAAAPAVGR